MMAEAWKLVQRYISQVQQEQKNAYNQRAKTPWFPKGEHGFFYKPVNRARTTQELARPFHGPYHVVEVGANTAKIRQVEHPEEDLSLWQLIGFASALRSLVMTSGLLTGPNGNQKQPKLHLLERKSGASTQPARAKGQGQKICKGQWLSTKR